MITFRSSFSNFQITFPSDEYCIYREVAEHPMCGECEALVIHTPRKKYKMIGIDTGKLEGYEFVQYVLDYIKSNNSDSSIYIDLDTIVDSEYCNDIPAIILKVEE